MPTGNRKLLAALVAAGVLSNSFPTFQGSAHAQEAVIAQDVVVACEIALASNSIAQLRQFLALYPTAECAGLITDRLVELHIAQTEPNDGDGEGIY